MQLMLLLSFVLLVMGTKAAAAVTDDVCKSAAFTALPPTTIGSSPITIKSLVQNDQICLEFALINKPNAKWFAVGLARSDAMVSSPPANVMLFETVKQNQPFSYKIVAETSSGTTKEADQSHYTLSAASTTEFKFTYQRALKATVATDVAIELAKEMNLIWAFGETNWPITSHKRGTMGVETYTFASTGGTVGNSVDEPFCDQYHCTGIIAAVAFGSMLLGGLIVSKTMLQSTGIGRLLLHKTLATPPTKRTTNAVVGNPLVFILQNLADLRVGELVIMLIFAGAVAAVVIVFKDESRQVISGHVALLVLLFLVLPVARIPILWCTFFGNSFERVIKFHRWLGMCMSLVTLIHLILALEDVDVLDKEEYGSVIPLYGFLAFLSFILMGFLANEFIRRMMFEVFYLSHRVLSMLGFVFSILHSARIIGYAMIVPLALYGFGLLYRWLSSFYYSFSANVRVVPNKSGITTILLEPSAKARQLVASMPPSSYFWVYLPSVSLVQWHPFSAMATPNGSTIGFCIKSMGPKTYTEALLDFASKQSITNIRLCGPFGRLTVNVDDYETVLLIAGGVGITPMFSLINHMRLHPPKKSNKKPANWFLVWSVRVEADLLMADTLMPSTSPSAPETLESPSSAGQSQVNLQWTCHVSKAASDGFVVRANGEHVPFKRGRPVLEELINTSRFMNQKVAVLVCGPPTMSTEVQALARGCDFDFHKEVFSW